MSFGERSEKANMLIEIIQKNIWEHFPHLCHVAFGYETHIDDEVRKHLQTVYSETARHIRYAPDFFVVDYRDAGKVYLLEYKCTQTPIYSEQRIRSIGNLSGREELRSHHIGVWERDAFDNYSALHKMGIRVAILNYIAYHKRLLLCDFIQNIQELHRARVRTRTSLGSRTPIVNFDAYSMSTLQEFLAREHGISDGVLDPLIRSAKRELMQCLPIIEHPRSQRQKRTT